MKQTNEMNIANDGLLPFDPIVLVMDVAKRWLRAAPSAGDHV